MADYLLSLLKDKKCFSKKNIDIMILILYYTLTFFWQVNGKIINYLHKLSIKNYKTACCVKEK